jgi:phospholipase/carboxylesterase
MPDFTTARRDDRPTEGFTTTLLPSAPDRPVRLFLPADYQAKYAYPLVVLFHGDRSDEDAAARLIPGLSRRNYIAACPRGSLALGSGTSGRPQFSWDQTRSRVDDYLLETVAQVQRDYHVHAERIYLVGVGSGAAIAYRLGLALADEIAGVVVLNGQLPLPTNRSRRALHSVCHWRVFIGHGLNNPIVPYSSARRATRLFHSAGAEVRLTGYPTTQRTHPDMLRDVNRWIMGAVNTELDATAMTTPT